MQPCRRLKGKARRNPGNTGAMHQHPTAFQIPRRMPHGARPTMRQHRLTAPLWQ